MAEEKHYHRHLHSVYFWIAPENLPSIKVDLRKKKTKL